MRIKKFKKMGFLKLKKCKKAIEDLFTVEIQNQYILFI